MDELIRGAPRRLVRSLTTWPDRRGWVIAATTGAATLAMMAVVGFSGGLYALHPANTAGLAGRLVSTLVIPALGEETVFRGLLVPDREESARPAVALVAATAVFTLWHVIEATTFLTSAAPMFLRPDFLACAAILGLGCGIMRWRTRSLWPGVATHWLMVNLWQIWLGGFTL